MLKFRWLVQSTYTTLPKSQFSCCVCDTLFNRHGFIYFNKHDSTALREYHSCRRTPYSSEEIAAIQQTVTQRKFLRRSLQQWSINVDRSRNDVLEEARFQMGYPNWYNMFKTCFLGVSVNTGPEDITNLLLSFVENYFQDKDFEIECLIVLLLASMSEKLAQFKHREQHSLSHHQQHSLLPSSYEEFRAVTNPGHVTLANSLTMTRILILVQQISTKVETKNSEGNEHNDSINCSKLDKVRILLSDLFIAAVFKEAAVMKNPLILQYSFKAMNSAIKGIFRNHSKKNELENTKTEFVRENPLKKTNAPFKPNFRLGLDMKSGVYVTSGGYRMTKINKFSTLLREQALRIPEPNDHLDNSMDPKYMQSSTSDNIEYVKTVESVDDECGMCAATEKEHDVSIKRRNETSTNNLENSSIRFMERGDNAQVLYGWGWTPELGVTCQGCVVLSGLGQDAQKAAYEFGRTISLMKQMQWNGDIDRYQEDRYMARLVSYLGDFPDCANKRLLISLCKAYITS